jgi:hypothetical protein
MEGDCFAIGAITQRKEKSLLGRSGIQREERFRIDACIW